LRRYEGPWYSQQNHETPGEIGSVTAVKYAIITNPVSGAMTVDQKRLELAEAAGILNAGIHGLDAVSVSDFSQRARELAGGCDVLVVAGGDGTLSDVINAIDTVETPIAYLPLGTGNAMRYALGHKGGLADIAMRIRNGRLHEYDLVGCGGRRRGFMASVGVCGQMIQSHADYRLRGITGFKAYLRSLLKAYLRDYQPTGVRITVDQAVFEVENLLSLMVVKQPYFGFGMKVVPRASFGDGHLHVLYIASGLVGTVLGLATSFTIGNRVGHYTEGRLATVFSEDPMTLQIDGNVGWNASEFAFSVLPKALKIIF